MSRSKAGCEIDAICRFCGIEYKKHLLISATEFEKSSDTLKHFIRKGVCGDCRIKHTNRFAPGCMEVKKGNSHD